MFTQLLSVLVVYKTRAKKHKLLPHINLYLTVLDIIYVNMSFVEAIQSITAKYLSVYNQTSAFFFMQDQQIKN